MSATVRALPSPRLLRAMEALSVLELATLAALLINLAAARSDALASALGPIHGGLYLCVGATALLGRNLRPGTRLLAPIPLIGGGLTLWRIRVEWHRSASAGSAVGPPGRGSGPHTTGASFVEGREPTHHDGGTHGTPTRPLR